MTFTTRTGSYGKQSRCRPARIRIRFRIRIRAPPRDSIRISARLGAGEDVAGRRGAHRCCSPRARAARSPPRPCRRRSASIVRRRTRAPPRRAGRSCTPPCGRGRRGTRTPRASRGRAAWRRAARAAAVTRAAARTAARSGEVASATRGGACARGRVRARIESIPILVVLQMQVPRIVAEFLSQLLNPDLGVKVAQKSNNNR